MKTIACLFAALVITACKADPPPAPPPAPPSKPATTYTCMIQVSPKVDGPFEGHAEGPKEDKVLEAAWAAACAKLPAADLADCKNEKKFSVSKFGGSAAAGGPVTFSQTVHLERIPPLFEAREKSTDKDAACKAALESACKQAGSPGDCLAGGKFEKKGFGTTTETGSLAF